MRRIEAGSDNNMIRTRRGWFSLSVIRAGQLVRSATRGCGVGVCIVYRTGFVRLQAVDFMAGRIRHPRYLANMSRARSARAVYEHEQILAPLGGSRPDRLSLILKRHLANKLEAVRKSLLNELAETVPDYRIVFWSGRIARFVLPSDSRLHLESGPREPNTERKRGRSRHPVEQSDLRRSGSTVYCPT